MRAPFAPGYPYFDIRLYRNSVIVQGVPTVGISRTKRRYYIGTYIVLIESRLLRCKGCYPIIAGSTLAASNIRNLDCSSYEVYLIDYGCGKFNKKVHIME